MEVQSGPDFDSLRNEILELHEALIEAHFNKNVDFLVGDLSENFFSVSNGEIRRPTTEEVRSNFETYLGTTTFTEYRDLHEPLIDFSDDGSLAWSVVQVKVGGKRTGDDGSERELDFTCAWMTLYRRLGDKWVRLGEVSSVKH